VTSTERPPLSRAAHSSREKASQPTGAARGTVVRASKWAKLPVPNRRAVARCGETTPLGRPVVPEVKNTQHGAPPLTSTGRKPALEPAPAGLPGGAHTGRSGRSAAAAWVTSSGAPSSAVTAASRGSGQDGSSSA
jgi:hypothetical protein